MVTCSVRGCKSTSRKIVVGVTFHRFPDHELERNQWIKACGRVNWKPPNNSRVCSIHFEKNLIKKLGNKCYLDPLALPTIEVCVLPDPQIASGSAPSSGPSTKQCNFNIDVLPEPPQPISMSPTVKSQLEGVDRALPEQPHVVSGSPVAKRQLEGDDCVLPETPKSKKPKLLLEKSSAKRKISLEEVDTPRKKKLRQVAAHQKKKIRAIRQAYRRLSRKNAELKEIVAELQLKYLISGEDADILNTMDQTNKDFLKRFIGVQFKKQKYSPALRKFALCLHFISPRAYNYVRTQFNTSLPHPQTLVNWYKAVDGDPGFTNESLEAIKNKVSVSNKKIFGCLSFDEMSIRKAVSLSGTECFGTINVGINIEGDNVRMATQALVFMVTALNDSWKIPVGYFLIDRITAEQKAELVTKCLRLVFACNIDIVSVTCDGCPSNFAMSKILGCNIDGDSDNLNPVFKINIQGVSKEVCFFPDPPHMLKLLRNLLGDKGLLLTNNKIVAWKYFEYLHAVQQNEGLHLANKLTKAHLKFRKQIMKVKLAAQIFSNSVADAIEYCEKEIKLKEFEGSSATVDFIRRINNLFDVLNSRNINAYGFKKPLNKNNFEEIDMFLLEMIEYLKHIQLSNGQVAIETNRKTCLIGFRCCIQSVRILYKRLVESSDLVFLPIYKLSQDHIECFFSAIRSKGGFNNNPSAIQFRAAYKRLVVHGELKHIKTGNCTSLENINILMYTNSRYEKSINSSLTILRQNDDLVTENVDENDVAVDLDHDYLADPTRLTEFSKQIISYIAGFIVTRVCKIIQCEDCLISLIDADPKNKFKLIEKKDKGGLHYPAKNVVDVCTIAENIFRRNLFQLGSRILEKKKTDINFDQPGFENVPWKTDVS